MKKMIKKTMLSRILALVSSLTLIFSCNAISYAAESNVGIESNSEKSVNGSLSGYGYKYDTTDGSFTISVEGSWSPFAGCTIKTEGFSSSSQITVGVYDSEGSCKTTKTLGANDEKANIAIFNVPVGTYTIRYSILNPSGGSIQVWIY